MLSKTATTLIGGFVGTVLFGAGPGTVLGAKLGRAFHEHHTGEARLSGDDPPFEGEHIPSGSA